MRKMEKNQLFSKKISIFWTFLALFHGLYTTCIGRIGRFTLATRRYRHLVPVPVYGPVGMATQ